MDVAVAGVAGNAGDQAVFAGQAENFRQQERFLVDGDDDVFFADDETFGADCLGKGLAGLPDFIVVGDEDRRRAVLRAELV